MRSVVVVGGGIAGLAAGCYGRLEGYETTVLEQGAGPGGLATCWRRDGYTINGGLALVAGTGPGTAFEKLWRDLGVVPGLKVVDCDHPFSGSGKDELDFS